MTRVSRWAVALTVAGMLCAAAPSMASADRHGTAPMASAAGCFSYHSAVAGFFSYLVSRSDCAVIGSAGYRVGYAWSIQPGTSTRICVQGQGFVPKNGRYVAKWYSMGCGTGGSGTAPWGRTTAYPKVRAKVQLGFLGGLYRWRH